MKIYYGLDKAGFYGFFDDRVHKSIPEDAVEITYEYYQELLEGQTAGQDIVPDESSYPILQDRE